MSQKPEWNIKNLKNWKGFPRKNQLLILLLVGVLLLVIAIPTSKQQSSNNGMIVESDADDKGESKGVSNSASVISATDYEDYEKMLETRVADALEQVEGVGKTEVMLTLKSSSEQVVEKDTVSSSQTAESTNQDGSSNTDLQTNSEKTSIYSQDSDGSQTPYVKKELTPQIEGVIVIAEGGDNSVVIQNVTEAIQALFGVEAHKIKIMKRNNT